ncbi:bifunctional serine/threonine-protein kinase/formylglycine-generating enzyme family protein [Polyangium spumosum]|uniref:SUMF1/EgtB/PvdO family nonheme iron enzyme n=1 Tax=Polyangium spumosum TaxID=889282 RepID=A0A6N7PW47_9BACT|nr:bifunctional serine/threonine-protein kinase/formylglycine-generating enzyme family protein [Polyangium spumosum]MRG96452.1 SUMF1/EgtB/PvdO family nonheme iron enzyme [Polyangium spumosum]
MSEPEKNRDPFQLCGTTIEGKYRVTQVIGDGGFGVVYRGEHIGFGESIAIKCLKLPAELGEKQRAQFLEQLREEGRLLHRLSRVTSGIVQALDVGAFVTQNGTWVPYLVLEWLEGETLGELIKSQSSRGGMNTAEAIGLLEPAARALAVAHAQKIAHRDVKPANLFVTDVGGKRTVKVLDFGIAKVLTEHASFTEALAATRQGPTAFTPRYGAPEQFNKQRGATGPWTDVFALALIFVELVSARKALEGDDPTELYIIAADPSMRPTPRARGAQVSEAVERVIERALSVEPKHRYPDAGAFWDALVAAATGEGAGASRVSSPDKLAALPPTIQEAHADSLLSTAEFAEKKQLGVVTEQRSGAGGLRSSDPFGPTEAAPTIAKPGARPAGADATRDRDPMAETPLGERLPQPSQTGPKQPSATPLPTRDNTERTGLDATGMPQGKNKPVWPWLVGALLVGGGALGYTLLTMGSPKGKPTDKPVASATASVKGRPSAVPSPTQPTALASASASASAMPSASAAAPFVPPRDMVLVAPGTAKLGEGPDQREVTLTKGFYLDVMEVTTGQYRACVTAGKCPSAKQVVLPPESAAQLMAAADAEEDPAAKVKPEEFAQAWTPKCNDTRDAAEHPINCVTHAAAVAYCSFRERRLPTEAEWELAARGTAARIFPWGEGAPTCNRACFDRNGKCIEGSEGVATCPAGGRPRDRTPDGLFDMGGNVAEWVADGYASPPPAGADPFGPTSVPMRVVRGGSFLDAANHIRASHRIGIVPNTAHVTIGFRCALDAPPEPEPAPTPAP